MKDLKHTPAPWTIIKVSLLNEIIIKGKAQQISICRMYGDNEDTDYPNEDERLANSKLIAHAPDMKEALMVIKENIETNLKNGDTLTVDEMNAILRIITKATE